MAKSARRHPVIPREALKIGYDKTVRNAFELSQGSMELLAKNYMAAALGLAELAQEEIGKSLSILAAFGLPADPGAWTRFWSEWRDHVVKAHRAFLYELIHPTRVEIFDPKGQRVAAGLPFRAKISQEKEAAFYVEYDEADRTFNAPSDIVGELEVFNRTVTVIYLAVTAFYVQNALTLHDADFRLAAFGEIALQICSTDVFHEDMPTIFDAFAKRSSQHSGLMNDLAMELERADAYIHKLMVPPNHA